MSFRSTTSVARFLRHRGEPTQPSARAPPRDPPYFKPVVVQRRHPGEPSTQGELFQEHWTLQTTATGIPTRNVPQRGASRRNWLPAQVFASDGGLRRGDARRSVRAHRALGGSGAVHLGPTPIKLPTRPTLAALAAWRSWRFSLSRWFDYIMMTFWGFFRRVSVGWVREGRGGVEVVTLGVRLTPRYWFGRAVSKAPPPLLG